MNIQEKNRLISLSHSPPSMVDSEGQRLVRKMISVLEKLLFSASKWGAVSAQVFWEKKSKIIFQYRRFRE